MRNLQGWTIALVFAIAFAPRTASADSGSGSSSDVLSPVTAPAPSPVNADVYLRVADTLPSTWLTWSSRFSDDARRYRLGALTLSQMDGELQLLDSAAGTILRELQQMTPPDQFSQVHQLNLATTAEYRDAFEAARAAVDGDESSYAIAESDFDQAASLAQQAMTLAR